MYCPQVRRGRAASGLLRMQMQLACQRKYVEVNEGTRFPIKVLGPGLVPMGQVA